MIDLVMIVVVAIDPVVTNIVERQEVVGADTVLVCRLK